MGPFAGSYLYDTASGDLEEGQYALQPNGSIIAKRPPFVSSTSTPETEMSQETDQPGEEPAAGPADVPQQEEITASTDEAASAPLPAEATDTPTGDMPDDSTSTEATLPDPLIVPPAPPTGDEPEPSPVPDDTSSASTPPSSSEESLDTPAAGSSPVTTQSAS